MEIEEAKSVVYRYVRRPRPDLDDQPTAMAPIMDAVRRSAQSIIIDDRKTVTLPYGWVFTMGSGDDSLMGGALLGGCPLLVTKSDGKVHRLSGGFGTTVDQQIEDWKKGPGREYLL